jgi:hypothetical protein
VPTVSFGSVPGFKYVKAPANESEVNEVRRSEHEMLVLFNSKSTVITPTTTKVNSLLWVWNMVSEG